MSFIPASGFYWELLERYFARFPARHILLMNLDEFLISLGTGKRAPADLSGILFLPQFAYRDETHAPFRLRTFSAVQEQLVRRRLLSNPQMRVVFFLDQTVVDSLRGMGTADVAYLPDPVRIPERYPTPRELDGARRRLNIPANRKLFLLFGDIRTRKGVWKLFKALAELTPEECAKICLAIVGHAEPIVERRIAACIEALSDKPVAVIREASYVPDAVMHEWFDVADVVLAPYIRHVGSSNVLLLAAAHRRPSISQEFGLMGNLTRDNHLGVTVNSSDPKDLARAMRAFLASAPLPGWDPEIAYAFAKSQSHERFGAALFDALRPYIT